MKTIHLRTIHIKHGTLVRKRTGHNGNNTNNTKRQSYEQPGTRFHIYCAHQQNKQMAEVLFTKTRRTEHHKTPSTHTHTHARTHTHTHTQDQTQYRRPTVNEHDHHWDSQQDFN
jgi:hypothetical protein